jgi:hypothetical protein
VIVSRALLVLGLSAFVPLAAGQPDRAFYIDIHQASPGFNGHFAGRQDGQPVFFDVKSDLGLEKSSSKAGFALEYQGPRFGVEFSMDQQDYKGSNHLTRQITVDGKDYPVGVFVNSAMKIQNSTFNWTIRVLSKEQGYLGIDLGARIWDVDLHVVGDQTDIGFHESSSFKAPLPIPQIGFSAGFNAFERKLVGRGFYHFLSVKGASYQHLGADLRYFPLSRLGVRVFIDNEGFRVPKGSLKDDLDLDIDRNGIGFGLIARF